MLILDPLDELLFQAYNIWLCVLRLFHFLFPFVVLFFFSNIKVITHTFISFFLIFSELFFLIIVQVTMHFLLLSSFLKCSFFFFSFSRLSHIIFFPFFSYFLNSPFSLSSKLFHFSFFFCCPLFYR